MYTTQKISWGGIDLNMEYSLILRGNVALMRELLKLCTIKLTYSIGG